MWIIYKVTFPNGKIYIGQTSRTLERRRYDHFSDAKHSQPNKRVKFHRAILKYKDITWEQIDTASSLEEAIEKEAKFIEFFDSINNGYNCRTNRNGNGILSEETKKLIAVKNSEHSIRSWKNNNKRKNTLSNRMKALHADGKMDNAKVKITQTRRTEEQRLSTSKDNKERYSDPKAREKMAISLGARPFLVYKDGNLIGRFTSQSEAGKTLNLNRAHISNCLNGRRKTLHGYSFIYEPETDSIMKCKN